MVHLTVSVLGELQVLIDGVPITSFESDKVRALLAYLAVEADHSQRRETLTGLLWPDCPEETARHNLRQALFNLRLALGDHTAKPPYLLVTREAIQFNRESNYSLDLAQFNAYFDAWTKNRDRERRDTSRFTTQLEEMVGLYRGDFLQQFFLRDSAEFEEWTLIHRETLHQHVLDALTYLTNEYEQQGDYVSARRHAMRQLELDPWKEEAHCQLMRVLALDGQRSAALAQYKTCQRVLMEELGVEPSTETRELYEQIRLGPLKTGAEGSSHQVLPAPLYNLPVSLTPFIGREQELADLGRLIADPRCRCISLVGPGGMGKTRLALQAADQHTKEFAQGIAFIPLASVGSVEAVIPALASAIQFAFYGPNDPKVQLFNYLREKQVLLVVDNVEHLLGEGPGRETVADLLVELLRQDPGVKLLVTSREAMNLQGEWLFEVQGLSFPTEEHTDGMDEFGAVALFVQCARRARPGLVLNAEDKNGVVRVCRLVEGMPLAIELAATWVRVLSSSEIATEIEHSLDFLNTQMHDLPERHRSMQAVFDYSWQVLSADEQQVLSRLSVFRGGFRRNAAEQVAGATLLILSSLVTRSLLRRTSTGRYDLHELVRQYTSSKLAEDIHKLQSVQERHSHYYLALLEEKDGKLHSSQQKEVLSELTAEIDNIRAAWDCSITKRNFLTLCRVSTTFWYLFELHNWWKDGEVIFWNTAETLRAYRGVEGEDANYPIALNLMLAHSAFFKFRLGKSAEAYVILSSSASFLRTSVDPSSASYPLCYLGVVCWEQGKFSEAKESFQQGFELSTKNGDLWGAAYSNEFLGIIAHEQGAYGQARQYLDKSLAIARQMGDPMLITHVLGYLGRTTRMLGDYEESEKVLWESVAVAREIEYRCGIGLALDALALVMYAEGKQEEAQSLFSESGSLFREIGDTYRESRVLNHQGLNYLALNQVVEAQLAFNAALRMAHEGGYIPSALDALAGLAALDTRQKASAGTLDLVISILQHPVSTQEAKNLAARLRVELESRLAPEQIESSEARAGSKSLDELVVRVLASTRIIPQKD